MNNNPMIIINNEKVYKENNEFYCDNFDMKATPEGLSNYCNVQFIARSSKKKGNNKINLKDIKVGSNIFKFIYLIYKTFRIPNANYLLVTITPYTFCSFLILFLFRKKIYIYLMSNGYEEWKHILGSWSVWIFHIMHTIVTSNSKVISCNPRLYDRQRSFLVNPSRLNSEWFKNYNEVPLDKIRLLYVGRINPEKGIYDFIKMFDKIKLDSEFSIVGYKKNLKIKNKNIKLLGYCSEPKSLINIYDNHNIMILPSFTEAHPYVVDECLSRKRPVIIFESISYIATSRQGIFVSKRDLDSFLKVVNYIINNYKEVQKSIEKNKLPTKEDFFRQFSDIFKE